MTEYSSHIEPAFEIYINAVSGKKATDIVLLDLRGLTSVADAFIICSGKSNRQVSAIAEHILLELKKFRKIPLSKEGMDQGHWVLLDYGDVVIHVFYDPIRDFYNLEGLWADAGRLDISDPQQEEVEDADENEDE